MALARILRAARMVAGRRSSDKWCGLRRPLEMRRIIARERIRTDRSGAPFTLIALTPDHPEDRRTLAQLSPTIKGRLRLTDEAGWLSERQLAVVLPSTPIAGAWKVADDLCLSVPPERPLPVCKVYCYPSDLPTDRRAGADPAPADRKDDEHAEPLEALYASPLSRLKRGLDILGASAGMALLLPFLRVFAQIALAAPAALLRWGAR